MSLNIRYWLAERQIELAQLARPGAHVAGVAFRIVQDMEVKSLTPFDISALAEVLELPLGAARLAIEPIAQLSVWLLRILSRKKPLKRNEGTWLTFQVAYLNALQGILEQESHLRRPWLNRAIDFASPVDFAWGVGAENSESLETKELAAHSKFNPFLAKGGLGESQNSQFATPTIDDQQLIALLKTLRPGRLSDSQAEQTLSLVGDSFLVQQMNNTAVAWFVANGAEETEAKLLTQRLAWGLPGYLLSVIAENALQLAQLQKFVRLGDSVRVRDTAGLQVDNQFASNEQKISEFSVVNAEFSENYPLNLHRENYRAKLLQALSEPLLGEPFALKDIYVPLKGMPLDVVGKLPTAKSGTASSVPTKSVDLMEWAISELQDTTTIAVIEGDAGCGKTSFCQMLAARVAQELYPRWLPVSIRLRDAKLGSTLEQTLDSAFPLGRFTNRDGWFSRNSPPCLLILDGLDELPGSAHTAHHLQALLEQLVQFQKDFVASGQGTPRHKFLITARSDSVIGDRSLVIGSPSPLTHHPSSVTQFARIGIQPMEQEEFRQWFQHWSKLQSKSIAQGYFAFLKQAGVFRAASPLKALSALIRQPLMLYLLGILHRDGQLDDSLLSPLSLSQLKFAIYDRVCRWLVPSNDTLGRTHLVRVGLAHASRSPEAIANLLQNRTPQVLRHQMQVAALTILQSGQFQVPQTVVQTRLTEEISQVEGSVGRNMENMLKFGEAPLSSLSLEQTPYPQGTQTPPTTPTILPALFFRFLDGKIEFSHPNLGEYLCAEEIAAGLKTLTKQVQHPYGEVGFAIHSPSSVAKHIYTALGYGLLSTELEDYVVERLRREEARSRWNDSTAPNPLGFSFSVLFERLYRFYRAYCRGRWLDEGIAHEAREKLAARSNPLNVLQVDAAVGLNVFLLLCAIARAAQISFWPCGDPRMALEFDADALLTLIGRTSVLSPTAFWQRMCYEQATGTIAGLSQVQLAGACLNHAMLKGANFWQANLSFASLIGTNLSGANLQEADLSWANLAGADLFGVNLSGTKLEGADLSGANLLRSNLTLANLANACLYEAKLDEESKNMAVAMGAIFSLDEFQVYKSEVLTPKSRTGYSDSELPDNLQPTPSTMSHIESAEGEPILPESFSDRYRGKPNLELEYAARGSLVPSDDVSDSDYEGETALVENPLEGNI